MPFQIEKYVALFANFSYYMYCFQIVELHPGFVLKEKKENPYFEISRNIDIVAIEHHIYGKTSLKYDVFSYWRKNGNFHRVLDA